MLLEWCRAMTRSYEVHGGARDPSPGQQCWEGLCGAKPGGWEVRRGQSPGPLAEAHRGLWAPLARSTWTSRTSPQAGAVAWPSAPSSTSSSPMPLTMLRWTPPSAGTTSPWPSPQPSKPCQGTRRWVGARGTYTESSAGFTGVG